jgi:hypothetical protein
MRNVKIANKGQCAVADVLEFAPLNFAWHIGKPGCLRSKA